MGRAAAYAQRAPFGCEPLHSVADQARARRSGLSQLPTTSVLEQENVVGREFAYINATMRNRQGFVRAVHNVRRCSQKQAALLYRMLQQLLIDFMMQF